MDTINPGVTGRRRPAGPRVSDPGVFNRRIEDTRALWPSRTVCAYFGDIVPRSLNRWKNDPKLGFPQPITINGRDYYDPREIEDFKLRRRALAKHVESANAVLEKPATEPVAESAPKRADSPPARSRDKATRTSRSAN